MFLLEHEAKASWPVAGCAIVVRKAGHRAAEGEAILRAAGISVARTLVEAS
jgi:hypothetical protein